MGKAAGGKKAGASGAAAAGEDQQQPSAATGKLSLGPLIAKPGRDSTNRTAAAAAAAGGGGGRAGRGAATTAAAAATTATKVGDLSSVRQLLDTSMRQAQDSMMKQAAKLDTLLQSHVEAAYREGDKHRNKTVGYLEEANSLLKQVQGAHQQNMVKLKEYNDQTAALLSKSDAAIKKDLDAVKQGALTQLAALRRKAGISG